MHLQGPEQSWSLSEDAVQSLGAESGVPSHIFSVWSQTVF